MMISIVQHIEYLMMYNDCVVVPGWGALIANYTSSSVDGGKVLQPKRSIGFNASINHNDGLLANSLMRRHKLNYDQACKLIYDNVTTFNRHVMQGNELAFGHLGYFKLADKERLEFMPMPLIQACDEFFGLNSIDMTSLTSSIETQEPVFKPVAVTWQERLKVAASIAVIVGVGLLLSTPVIIDRSTQTASLNVTEVKTQPTTSSVTVKPASKATADDNKFAYIDDSGKATKIEPDKPTKNEKTVDSADYEEGMPNKGNYCLVINSCSTAKKATEMKQYYANKGIKTQVVKRGKYHHLAIAKSDSKQELNKIKKTLSSKYKRAWVCR